MREPGTYRSRVNAAENAVADARCREHAAEAEAERMLGDMASSFKDAQGADHWFNAEPEEPEDVNTNAGPEPATRTGSAFDTIGELITEEAPAAVIRRAASWLRVWEAGLGDAHRTRLCPESEHELVTTDAEGNRRYVQVPHGTTYRVTRHDTGRYSAELVKVTTLVTRLGRIITETEPA